MEQRHNSIITAVLILGVIVVLCPSGVLAHSVTFDFTGTFVAADPHSLGGIFTVPILSYPASTVGGSFTFETDTLDSNSSSSIGFYEGALTHLSLSVSKPLTGDAYQFGFNAAGGLTSIQVNADSTPSNQAYVVSASVQNVVPSGPIVDGADYYARDLFLNLTKPSTTVFTSDALQATPPDPGVFSLFNAATNPNGQFRLVLQSSHGDHSLIGNLTSLTLSAVPVPAALYLFGTGVVGMAVLARRRLMLVA